MYTRINIQDDKKEVLNLIVGINKIIRIQREGTSIQYMYAHMYRSIYTHMYTYISLSTIYDVFIRSLLFEVIQLRR